MTIPVKFAKLLALEVTVVPAIEVVKLILYEPLILHEVLKLIPKLPSVQLGVAQDTGDTTVIL